MKRNVFGLMILFIITFFYHTSSLADKASPFPVKLKQSDGTEFLAKVFGDEYFHWIETIEGYSIKQNKQSKNWEYVTKTNSDDIVLSGLIVTKDNPVFLEKHIIDKKELETARQIKKIHFQVFKKSNIKTVVEGMGKPLVILVDFNGGDQYSHKYLKDQFNDMLFSDGNFPTGSMNDYFKEVSYGKYSVQGHVVDWITAPNSYDYYCNGDKGMGDWPRNSQGLTHDMVLAIDSEIDFSSYDSDNDGYVDGIIIVVEGEYNSASADRFWAHKFSLGSHRLQLDGVIVNKYFIINEQYPSGNMRDIGTFCHEWGHVLGIRDLYDYSDESEGIGEWGIMGSGNWNSQTSPAHFCAWSKVELGWVNPVVVTNNQTNVSIPDVESNSTIFKLWTEGLGINEYFLLENRQAVKFDKNLNGEGLLIWHIDETISNNDNKNHKKVDLEEADGENDLDYNRNRGDSGDPFPGNGGVNNPNTSFNFDSYPGSSDYNGNDSKVQVLNMRNSDNSSRTMIADLYVTSSISDTLLDIPDNLSGRPGYIINIPVVISQNLPNEIYAYDFELNYDNTVLEPYDPYFDINGTLSSQMSVSVNPSFSPNKVKVVAYGTSALAQDSGNLIYVKFKIKDSATDGTYPLSISNFIFNSGASSVITSAGSISVTSLTVSFPDDFEANTGDTVEIPIKTTDTLFSGIYAFEFEMDVNNSIMEPCSPYYVNTNTLSQSFLVTVNPGFTLNKMKVVAYGTNPLQQSSGTIIFVKMKIKDNAAEGEYPVSLSNFLFNSNAVAFNPGKIKISSGISINGTINYCSYQNKYIPNADITFSGPSSTATTTNNSGYYAKQLNSGTWTITPSKSCSLYPLTGYDASLVARHSAGLITLSDNAKKLADSDRNNELNVYDAALIARSVAGFTSTTGQCNTWRFVPDNSTGITSSSTMNFSAGVIGDADLSGGNLTISKIGIRKEDQFFNLEQNVGNKLTIKVNNSDNEALYGMNFEIIYNPDHLKYIGLKSLYAGYQNVIRTTQGKINVVVYSTESLKSNEQFLGVEFERITLKDSDISIQKININEMIMEDVILRCNKIDIPIDFQLFQNYPNPFNSGTKIVYNIKLSRAELITLEIFDSTGRFVNTLVNKTQNSGKYEVFWNGCNMYGKKAASGVYYLVLNRNRQNISRKMLHLK